MALNSTLVGKNIADLRKSKNLTQVQLGERLNITYQAVSKWERGETLPDVSILVDLANILETTTDYILTGGEKVINYKGKITVADMQKGITCFADAGKYLGKDNFIYRYAIQGINEKMNTDIEPAFTDDYFYEAFVAEAIIQNLMAGYYIDISDVKNNFKHKKFRNIVCEYAAKYDIK